MFVYNKKLLNFLLGQMLKLSKKFQFELQKNNKTFAKCLQQTKVGWKLKRSEVLWQLKRLWNVFMKEELVDDTFADIYANLLMMSIKSWSS